MGRPRMREQDKKRTHAYAMRPGTVEAIDRIAREKGVSKSEVLEDLVQLGIDVANGSDKEK